MRRSALTVLTPLAVLFWFVLSPLVVNAGPRSARRKPGPVNVHGTAAHVTAHSFTLSTKQHGSYHVLLFRATQVVLRNTKQAAPIQNGERVSVRGLFSGTQLRAMTVHVFPAAVTYHTIRSIVTGRSGATLTIRTSSSTATVSVDSHTSWYGGTAAGSNHGVVLHVGPGSIVMVAKGTQITLLVPVRAPIVLDGHPSSSSNLRGGDRVAVRVQGPVRSPMSAISITARRPIVKALLVRGTILAARSHGVLVQNDRGGQQLQVQVVGPVRPTLNGAPVANEFLFPGAQVVVSGAMTHGVLVARSLVLHLKPEHTSGIVTTVSAGRLTITRRSGSTSLVLLPHLISITDAGKHLSETALRADMILKIAGYRAANKMLFAVRIQVAHPRVSIAARIATVSPTVVVQTSAGAQYYLRFRLGACRIERVDPGDWRTGSSRCRAAGPCVRVPAG